VPARLFRRIQLFCNRLNKKLLLSVLLFIAAVFFIGRPVFADANSDYATYLNLFNGTNLTAPVSAGGSTITFPQSGVFDPGSAGDLIEDPTTKDVTGLKVNIALGFSSNDVPVLENRWNHIQSGLLESTNNQIFLIRVCDMADQTSCWINTIAYSPTEASNQVGAGALGTTINQLSERNAFSANVYRNPIFITNYSLFSGDNLSGSYYSSRYKFTRNISSGKDEGTTSTFIPINFQKTSSVQVTMWYCATSVPGEADGSKAYQTVGNNPDQYGSTIATFGTSLCSGNSYFRIGTPITITIPATAAAVAGRVNTQKTTTGGSGTDNLPVCGIIPGSWTNGTINGCMAQVSYGLYYVCAVLARFFGELFDFFIGYSLSSASYQYAFAVTGWQLVRDISNVFFILIMVWTGFSAVFDTEKNSMKKVVPALIINALLINFSLFATRVVIDISNITARVFYNQMTVCQQSSISTTTGTCGTPLTGDIGNFPSLSTKIVSSFNPQKIFTPNVLKGFQDVDSTAKNTSASSFSSTEAGNEAVINNSRDYANFFTIVSLIAAALMIAIAIMFFKVAFLFLGRVVGLYICMIFSPFAFLSRDMPMLGRVGRLKWDDWRKELVSYAMLAPVFVFFLYLIYTLISSNFVQQMGIASQASGGFLDSVMSIGIPLLFIYFLMQAAQKAAESLSGDIGKAIQKFGTDATGLALGAATGGASFLGSQTLGRAANKISNNENFKDWAARNGTFGKAALKSVDSIGKSSFDARNTVIGKGASKQFGLNLDQKTLSIAGLDTKSRKGGYVQRQDDKVKSAEEYKKLIVTKKSDDEIQATYTTDELTTRYKYDDKEDAALNLKWQQEITLNDISKGEDIRDHPENYSVTGKEWKAYKKKNKDDAYSKSKKAYGKNVPPPAVYLTAAERNKARTDAYADKMEKKSGGPFATQDYKNAKGDIVVRKGELVRNPYALEKLTGSDGKTYGKGEKIAEENTWKKIVYNGTTNKRIGGAFRTEPKKRDKILDDLIKETKKDTGEEEPPAPAAPAAPAPTSPTPTPTPTP
jgi:hypothetical protein